MRQRLYLNRLLLHLHNMMQETERQAQTVTLRVARRKLFAEVSVRRVATSSEAPARTLSAVFAIMHSPYAWVDRALFIQHHKEQPATLELVGMVR